MVDTGSGPQPHIMVSRPAFPEPRAMQVSRSYGGTSSPHGALEVPAIQLPDDKYAYTWYGTSGYFDGSPTLDPDPVRLQRDREPAELRAVAHQCQQQPGALFPRRQMQGHPSSWEKKATRRWRRKPWRPLEIHDAAEPIE